MYGIRWWHHMDRPFQIRLRKYPSDSERILWLKWNGNKSELIVINPSCPPQDRQITMGSDKATVVALPPHVPARYLGVWYKTNKGNSHTTNIVVAEIAKFTRLTNFKKVTNAHITYLCNTVLLPKLEYILSITFLSQISAEMLFRPIVMLVKKNAS